MAQYEDITIDQGADVAVEIHLTDNTGAKKNLANHSVAAKMKKTYNSDSDNTQAFNAIIATPPTSGIVTLSLTNVQTNALTAGRYVYDVELSFTDSDASTITERVLEGKVFVTPSVTK